MHKNKKMTIKQNNDFESPEYSVYHGSKMKTNSGHFSPYVVKHFLFLTLDDSVA